jgi:translation initiation factor IF-3
MPVPRRFDRRPPERDLTRVNERIRVPEVRLIGEDGQQVGVLKIDAALRYAQERDLDLVEVAPDARPPVCRVLDYSKYKYEQAQKLKAARRHQQQITVREIKFRPKIAQHDYDTKKGHVERFLRHRDKVKITIMFRGREVTHPERGVAILDRLAEELSELAIVEQRPTQDGRNMTMMLGPSKAILSGRLDAGGEGAASSSSDVEGTPADGETAEVEGAASEGPPLDLDADLDDVEGNGDGDGDGEIPPVELVEDGPIPPIELVEEGPAAPVAEAPAPPPATDPPANGSAAPAQGRPRATRA